MLGIVCGLKDEAAIAKRFQGALIACSAANPERARALTESLIAQGATRLLSFGLAAGIAPDLKAGDLVLPCAIYAQSDRKAENDQWPCSAFPWFAALKAAFPHARIGPLWGSSTLIATALEKKDLLRRANCCAADMESHIVAQVASAHGLPFAALRAIVDTASADLPPAAKLPLREDGGIDGRAIARSIARHPQQIGALIELGLATARAKTALRKASGLS